MSEFNKLKEQLEELTAIPAPSGFEDPMIKYMSEKISSYGIKSEVDPLGNVIAHLGNSSGKPKIMILAHMDEIGLIVRKIEPDGFLRVERIGGVTVVILPGCRVLVKTRNGNLIKGVIGSKSHHLTPVNERDNAVPVGQLYIDIGCSSKEEVSSLGVEVGSVVVYTRGFIQRGPVVFAPAIDNRGGCLILLQLIERLTEKKFNPEIFIVGTVQEEYSLRGVLPAARVLDPDFAIAIDCAISSDTPDLEKSDIKLGNGPVIYAYSFHGRGTLAGVVPNPKLRKLVEDASSKAGISTQTNVSYGCLTDASFLQLENRGIPSIEMGFPTRYVHTTLEVCHLGDIEKLIRLLEAFILNLPADVDLSRY